MSIDRTPKCINCKFYHQEDEIKYCEFGIQTHFPEAIYPCDEFQPKNLEDK